MAEWSTFPIEFKGGLVTNLSPLQQGINLPGTARELQNFEPSIEGGYRKVLGFTKINSAQVPIDSPRINESKSTTATSVSIGGLNLPLGTGTKFKFSNHDTEKRCYQFYLESRTT